MNIKEKYGVNFPIMDKVHVNGPNTHDIFMYLRCRTKELTSYKDPTRVFELPWNFCRWLVDSNGKVQMYLDPKIGL